MDDLAALTRASAKLGNNRLLVQAAGGNTSIKEDGVLWVKASGRWLAKALDEPIFAALDLPRLTRAMALGDPACETCDAFVRADLSAPSLRPSVETTLHAGLPQRFVLHVHCVETIANAVLEDGAARVAPLLDGLKWQWVPYTRPGFPLFRTITPGADIYVFANHGLVVAADTLEAAVALVATVGRRLARPIQAAPTRSARGVERAGYRFAAAAPALTEHGAKFAAAGTLYPDHLVFLGSGAAHIESVVGAPPVILAPGFPPLVREDLAAAPLALAECLGDVAARLAPDDRPRYFTAQQEYELTHWDAEIYRHSLPGSE
jgi:rhamnose utilization protein RhaD (predicted bifunctional aldolase and dehydrogenase)